MEFTIDETIYTLDESDVNKWPYFKKLYENKIYRSDLAHKAMTDILNGQDTTYLQTVLESDPAPQDAYIKIISNDEIFYTTINTLRKSRTLAALYELTDNNEITIILKTENLYHIMEFLRCPYYQLPPSCYDDAVYYGIDDDHPVHINNSNVKLANRYLLCNRRSIDKYLTNEPHITHYKTVYRRHTASIISCTKLEATYNENIHQFTINHGDIIDNMFLKIEYLDQIADIYDVKYIKIMCGNDFNIKLSGQTLLTDIYLNNPGFIAVYEKILDENILYLPLFILKHIKFPLIAVQDFKINVKLTRSVNCKSFMYWNSHMLDTDERKKFARLTHEYLMHNFESHKFSFDNYNLKLKINPESPAITAFIFKIEKDIDHTFMPPTTDLLNEIYIYDSIGNTLYYTDSIKSLNDFADYGYNLKYIIGQNIYIISFTVSDPRKHQPSGNLLLSESAYIIDISIKCKTGIVYAGYYKYNIMHIENNVVEWIYKHGYILEKI